MAASVFAAVGDRVFLSGGSLPGTECDNTKIQLDHWMNGIVRTGRVKLVLKTSDIPQAAAPGDIPGCILAIEGGDALEGDPDRVNEFYAYGVRMITLVHFSNNNLGDCMQDLGSPGFRPRNGGITAAGRRVIERMQELGMVVDVAHADSRTLKQIAELTRRPVVDSHGNPCALADANRCGRFRTWKDMEAVAKTGGVVCTWTWGMTQGKSRRETFRDWAREIMEMKKRIGMEHVGLRHRRRGRHPEVHPGLPGHPRPFPTGQGHAGYGLQAGGNLGLHGRQHLSRAEGLHRLGTS